MINPGAPILAPTAKAVRDDLVARSSAIERVAGETSQQSAVNVLAEISKMLALVEDGRKKAKAPGLEWGRRVDSAFNDFMGPLNAEKIRIKMALGQYQLEQDRIAREIRRKQEEELEKARAERKAAELAAQYAENEAQRAKAQEAMLAADVKAAETLMQAPAVVQTQAEGSKTKRGWDVEVLNPAELYKTHPECIELKPKMSVINAVVKKYAETLPEGEAPVLPGCKVSEKVDVSA